MEARQGVRASAPVVAGVALAIAVAAACSDGRSPVAPPIAPSPLPAAPPAGPGQGTIAIGELSPAAGATLVVQSDCPAGRVTGVCTDRWRGTFDVMVDREMTHAVLTVRFYDGQTKCGYGASTSDVVPAGKRVSFNVVTVVLSDEFGTFAPPCRLPATTNRIEVELWSDSSSWTNTLIQQFETAYTFSER
jgi:hypothetical protein